MKQARLHSLQEAVISTAIGFVLAYAVNLMVLPIFHRTMTNAGVAFWLTMVLTVASIIRQYFVRRLFNWWHHRRPESWEEAARDIQRSALKQMYRESPYSEALLLRKFEPDGVTHAKGCLCPDCCNSNY